MDANDDENIEDDFGVSVRDPSHQSQSVEEARGDDFLVDF